MMMPKKWGSTENSLGHVLEELVEIGKDKVKGRGDHVKYCLGLHDSTASSTSNRGEWVFSLVYRAPYRWH